MENASSQNKLIGLDLLRFLAALYLVIFHTSWITPINIEAIQIFIGMGYIATSTFFILSGFLLSHVYFKNGNTMRIPFRVFLRKRLYTLYPINIIGLFLYIITLCFHYKFSVPHATWDDTFYLTKYIAYLRTLPPESLIHYMSHTELFINFIMQLLMLQAWNPYYLTFNLPLWSISDLLFFYICFPISAKYLLAKKNKWQCFIVIWALYLSAPLWMISTHHFEAPYFGFVRHSPILRLPEFLAGITLYGIFREYKQLITSNIRILWGLGLFIVSCFSLVILTIYKIKYLYIFLHNGLFLPVECAIILLFSSISLSNYRGLQQWSVRLGAASLSMFALHLPIFMMFKLCIPTSVHLSSYFLYLFFTIAFCMMFQEKMIMRIRIWLLSREHAYSLPAN